MVGPLGLDLSAGSAGLRHVLVVLDAGGVLLSANDAVLLRTGPNGGPPPADCESPAEIRNESIGGRFEPDGSFRGTEAARGRGDAAQPGAGEGVIARLAPARDPHDVRWANGRRGRLWS